jgi:hypothetical protein
MHKSLVIAARIAFGWRIPAMMPVFVPMEKNESLTQAVTRTYTRLARHALN